VNHIARLTQERDDTRATIRATRDELLNLILYLRSDISLARQRLCACQYRHAAEA
jgi:hypothetical protein